MSVHNMCFHGEIRKMLIGKKKKDNLSGILLWQGFHVIAATSFCIVCYYF